MSRVPRSSFATTLWCVGVGGWIAAPALAQEVSRQREDVDPAKSLPIVEAPTDGRIVKVVDVASGEPVAGALVTWFEEIPEDAWMLAPEPRLLELRREFGKTVETGIDGTARVGKFERIVASSGDRYAGAWGGRRGSSLVLGLRARRSITVVTVDGEGNPVSDVPIVLRTREESGGSSHSWRARIGDDERAVIGPLDLFANLESEARHELWVAVDVPLAAPLRRRFTLAEIPETPVEFTMPPTGRLVIDVVDADGEPLDAPGFTSARAPRELAEDEKDDTPGARWPAESWYADDVRSHCELPHVETGLRLVVDWSADSYEDAMQIVDGPREPGETVSVRLVVPPAPPSEIVSGRILDEKGDALAGQEVSLLWNTDSTRQGRREIAAGRTDAAGRIEARLDRRAGRTYGEEFEPWIEAVVRRPDGDGILASGMVSLPRTSRIGGLNFGEIRVRPSPPLASGVVVDDTGAPVAGAWMRVTVFPLTMGSGSGDFSDHLLTATTDAEGRFTIWGDAPIGQISVSASAGDVERADSLWHSTEAVELRPGTTDLELVLWRCGTIVARVIGDPAEIEDLSYGTSSKRRDGEVVGGWHGGFEADGIVETDVVIGVAQIEISRGGTAIATFDDIEVGPGDVVELEPIVLAASPHQVELTIVDESGQPVPTGWIVMPDPDDDERFAGARKMFEMFGPDNPVLRSFPRMPNVSVFHDGRTTLRSEKPLPDFAVGAAGRTAVIVCDPATALRIVLEPAPYVALVLEYEGDPMPEPLVFQASLAAPPDDEAWFRFGPSLMSRADSLDLPRLDGITLERDQPIEIPVRCLGTTTLNLVLGEKSHGGFSGNTIGCDPSEIDVERTSDDQVFHVKVDRAAIDSILKQRAEHEEDGRRR